MQLEGPRSTSATDNCNQQPCVSPVRGPKQNNEVHLLTHFSSSGSSKESDKSLHWKLFTIRNRLALCFQKRKTHLENKDFKMYSTECMCTQGGSLSQIFAE